MADTTKPTLRCVTCDRLFNNWHAVDRHLVEEHEGHGQVAKVLPGGDQ